MNLIAIMADKYKLPLAFVSEFYNKVTDKQNFEYGLRMFVDGWLTYEAATDCNPLCVADFQKKYLSSMQMQSKILICIARFVFFAEKAILFFGKNHCVFSFFYVCCSQNGLQKSKNVRKCILIINQLMQV